MALDMVEQTWRKHDILVRIELLDDHYLLVTNGNASAGPFEIPFVSEKYDLNWGNTKGAESVQYLIAICFVTLAEQFEQRFPDRKLWDMQNTTTTILQT